MQEIKDYLMRNYYSKTTKKPNENDLLRALETYSDNVICIRKDGEIRGVAVFVTLSDRKYALLSVMDLKDIDTLLALLEEEGHNIHFILVCADSMRTILQGLRQVIRELKPKTVSWYNPDMTYLHQYNLN